MEKSLIHGLRVTIFLIFFNIIFFLISFSNIRINIGIKKPMKDQVVVSSNNHQKYRSKTTILREKITGDSIFKSFLGFTAFLIFVLIGLMIIILFLESSLSIETYGLEFLWGTEWNPTPPNPTDPPVFGILPPLLGTLVSSLIAILIKL